MVVMVVQVDVAATTAKVLAEHEMQYVAVAVDCPHIVQPMTAVPEAPVKQAVQTPLTGDRKSVV